MYVGREKKEKWETLHLLHVNRIVYGSADYHKTLFVLLEKADCKLRKSGK